MAAPERRTVKACPTADEIGDQVAAAFWMGGMQDQNLPMPARPVHCRVCTILIGNGYEERRPIPLTNGRGFICWQCYASVRRQNAKRDTTGGGHRATIR